MHAEAEEALRQALSIYDEIYGGAPHPRVAAAHNNLGRALQLAGRLREAEPHLARARDMAREVFGADDPRFIISTSNLGDLQRRLGHLDRAEELLVEALEMERAKFGPDHRMVGMGQSLLAALRLQQARYPEALELSERALALFRRIDYEHVGTLIAAEARRAQALAALGRHAEAMDAFETGLRIGTAAGVEAGTPWPELLAAYAGYLSQREDPAASGAWAQALAVHRRVLGADHPATLKTARMAGDDGQAVELGAPTERPSY
jgi:serine/threonine-protein kinase